MFNSTRTVLPLVVVCALALVACGGGDDTSKSDGGGSASAAGGIPESVWTTTAPAGAREVGDVRTNAKTDEVVVVKGRVKDIVDGRAVFTLIDEKLESCIEKGDGCPTPWDYCCEPSDDIANNTITIEIHDDSGRPLKASIKEFHGLDHLQYVTVSGKAKKDDAGNVTVQLTSLHRTKK